MDNITNGLYIYHIYIYNCDINCFFEHMWGNIFFASYIDIYILIGWFIIGLACVGPVRALKSVRTLWESNMESWEILQKMEDSIGKKRDCVDFHDFHGSQLLEMISPKYQTDFTWALDRPKVVLYVTHSGKISSQSYWSPCGCVWKWGAHPKWQCSWGHWSLTSGLWGAGCPIFDPCETNQCHRVRLVGSLQVTAIWGWAQWAACCGKLVLCLEDEVKCHIFTFFNRIFLGVMGWFN